MGLVLRLAELSIGSGRPPGAESLTGVCTSTFHLDRWVRSLLPPGPHAELHRFFIDEARAIGIDLSAPKTIGKR